jgi:transposase
MTKRRVCSARKQEKKKMKQFILWGHTKYEERNAGIIKAVLKGRAYSEVAQEYGLSYERIRQIVARYRRKFAKVLLTQTPEGKRATIQWLRENQKVLMEYLPPASKML